MSEFASRALHEPNRRRWLALIVVCLAQLMNTLDVTIVNVALPTIQADLHFDQANLTWVVNAYLISFGSFLLLAGRLGDLIGRKRVFLAGVAIFTLASAVCGLAQDQVVLVAARFVQGIGGAVSSSVIVAIIVTEFTEPLARARAMSTYVFVAVGGGSIGLVAALLGRALIRDNEGIGLAQGVDVLGSVLVTLALMLGIYAIVEAPAYGWNSAQTLGFGGTAVLLLAIFGILQARLANPILPPRILQLGSLTGSSVLRGLAATGMFGSFFFSALYLEHVLGFGPMRTGLAFLPRTLVVGGLSLGITARLVQRFGPRPTLNLGLLSIIAGLGLLAGADDESSYFPRLFFAFALMGVGAGMSFMPLLTIALADVPTQDAGLASGIVNVSMQLAAALGLAVLGSLASDRTAALVAQGNALKDALTDGYHFAYMLAAVCVGVGLLAAQVVLRSAPGAEEAEAPALDPLEFGRGDEWRSREVA